MIDVEKFMTDHKLDKKKTAEALFPGNEFPRMALKRITDGKALLNSQQVSLLAAMAGIDVGSVYSGGWEKTSGPDNFTLSQGPFKVVLDWETWVSRIFIDGTLLHKEVLTKPTVPLSEYIKSVQEHISDLEEYRWDPKK